MSEGKENKKQTKIIDGVEYQLNQYNEWCTYNKQRWFHSYNDKPAVISSDGSKFWYKNGLCHRDNDKPAVIYPNGTKYWYKNDSIYRDNDKPAIICSDGMKKWYKNGKYHRDNDKPAVIYPNGTKEWFKNGVTHRDNDRPAIIHSNGSKKWFVNGEQQPYKDYVCFYIKDGKQHRKFFETELQAKQYESDMLAKDICAWVIENV